MKRFGNELQLTTRSACLTYGPTERDIDILHPCRFVFVFVFEKLCKSSDIYGQVLFETNSHWQRDVMSESHQEATGGIHEQLIVFSSFDTEIHIC